MVFNNNMNIIIGTRVNKLWCEYTLKLAFSMAYYCCVNIPEEFNGCFACLNFIVRPGQLTTIPAKMYNTYNTLMDTINGQPKMKAP